MTESNTAELETPAPAATETVETHAKTAETESKTTEPKPAAAAKTEETPAPKGGQKPSIATGGDVEAEDKAKEPEKPKPYWPDNWREKMAEHYSAGDKKLYDKELRRLQRITDPASVYGVFREAEGKLTSGGLIKIPGKDAKPEEIADYHKAIGVPEKPEDYFKDIKLDNGAVIGEADKPLVDGFAQAVHKSGATPAFVNAALNWYYGHQEEQAAAMDEADDTFRRESERALKEEFGPTFKRKINAISSVFATAPGGTDITNEKGLYARLMGGRFADHTLIGNDPDMVRFLVGMAHEINPVATVVEDGVGSKGAETRLAEIKALRKTNSKAYWSEPIQREEAELIAALEKEKSRARA